MSAHDVKELEERLRQREREISALAEHQQKVINAWIARGDELGRRMSQLQGLLTLGAILFQPTPLERGFRLSVRKLQECLDAECAAIYELEGDTLRLKAQRGWTADMLSEASVLKLGQGVAGMAAEVRDMVVLDDISHDPRHTVLATQAAGVRSLLGVPIVVGGNVWGVIGIGCKTPGRLGELEKAMTRAFANLLATAVELGDLRKAVDEKDRPRVGSLPMARP